MSELWTTFCEKLKGSGYTLNDLAYCNDDLFLTIAQETGAFTPLEVTSLLREWRRRVPASKDASAVLSATDATTSAAVRAAVSSHSSSRLPPPPPPRSLTLLRRGAERLLKSAAGSAGAVFLAAGTNPVLVEAPPEAYQVYQERLAMLGPRGTTAGASAGQEGVEVLWKLCSGPTLAKIDRACTAGTAIIVESGDDADAVCPSANVFYRDTAAALSNIPAGASLATLADDGWALVAFDVGVGRSRVVSETEAAHLDGFTMAQCRRMLEDAGYDSLSIPSRQAIAVCHVFQSLPRAVVFLSAVPSAAPAPAVTATGGSVPSTSVIASPSVAASKVDQSRRLEYSTAGAVEEKHSTANATTALTTVLLRPTSCAVHPQKEVEFWSSAEKRLLCSYCLYYDGYSRENCMPIEQAIRQEAPRLERWVGNAATFTKEVQRVYDLFSSATDDVDRCEQQATEDIRQQFRRLRTKVDAVEAELVAQCQSKSQQRRQGLQTCRDEVTATVEEVNEILRDTEAPLKTYRAGSTDLLTCVSLLRGAQRAFGTWEAVTVPPYSTVKQLGAFLGGVEDALGQLPSVHSTAGKVELPEAIDVNFLKTDCGE